MHGSICGVILHHHWVLHVMAGFDEASRIARRPLLLINH